MEKINLIKSSVKFIIYDPSCCYGDIRTIGVTKVSEELKEILESLNNKVKSYNYWVENVKDLFEDLDLKEIEKLKSKFDESLYVLECDFEKVNKELKTFFTNEELNILFNPSEYDEDIIFKFYGKS